MYVAGEFRHVPYVLDASIGINLYNQGNPSSFCTSNVWAMKHWYALYVLPSSYSVALSEVF